MTRNPLIRLSKRGRYLCTCAACCKADPRRLEVKALEARIATAYLDHHNRHTEKRP